MDRRELLKKLLGGAAVIALPKGKPIDVDECDDDMLDLLADKIAERLAKRVDTEVSDMPVDVVGPDGDVVDPEALQPYYWVPNYYTITTTDNTTDWSNGNASWVNSGSSWTSGPIFSASAVVINAG